MSAQASGSKNTESKKTSTGGAPRGGLQKQLHKTKFCMYHLQGACRFGTECAFAHSLNEIHSTPDLRKTQLCKDFLEGRCRNENCNFAHDDGELRSTDVYFKKTLCIWNEKGKCRNGSQCRFAHGINELRSGQKAMKLAELGLGAEAGSERGQTQKGKSNGFSRQGNKSMGSSCSSVSCQSGESTGSGSSDGPGGSGGGSGGNSGSSGYNCNSVSSGSGNRIGGSQNEPMKVLQFDASPLARIEDAVANKSPQQARFASNMTSQSLLANTPMQPNLTEALEAFQNELHNHPQLEAVARGNYQSEHNFLHMELGVLRQTAALLTTRCLHLQERFNVSGNGHPSVMGNMDGQGIGGPGLTRNLGSFGYPGQAPDGLSPNGLNYAVGDSNLQAASFGQSFDFANGAFQGPGISF